MPTMMSTLPGGESFEDFLRLLFRPEAADHVDRHRKAGEPSRSVFRCWNARTVVGARNATCFAVHHGLEGGAHRHLGLAVADVAAQQAIHRRGASMSRLMSAIAAA